ncbi:hypothetical protein CLOM_g18994 [Closterium sp. NIES-68]|nr:hypothetical protein CLOM_g18994 [Closterium sp. NIES-68]GJP66165.1 hypothetical protein CLOP_g23071 [Closterium sp. NIES-67]
MSPLDTPQQEPSPTGFDSSQRLTAFYPGLKPAALEPSLKSTAAREAPACAPREAPSCAATVGIWSMNVVGAVGIIMVNKQVMSGYDFVFVSTLTGMHFALTALTGVASACAGLVPSKLSVPFGVLLGFALLGNASLVATNLSLLLNSVGFYQISKVSIIPTVCFLEAVFKGRSFPPPVKAAVVVVMVGVALCTVSEIHVNPLGLCVAAFAVLCSAMHMMLIGLLQERYSIGSFDLLTQSAPLQAFMLLLVGPSLDLWLTSRSLLDYHYEPYAIVFIALSCCLAVVCNLSAYLCIGTFSASTYQVLGHMKTVLVLVLGVLLFDSVISFKGILGMCIAVAGMVMYGHATATQATATGTAGGGGGGAAAAVAAARKVGREWGGGGGEEREREEILLLRILVDAEEGEEEGEEEEEEGEEVEDEREGEKGGLLSGVNACFSDDRVDVSQGTLMMHIVSRRAVEGEHLRQGSLRVGERGTAISSMPQSPGQSPEVTAGASAKLVVLPCPRMLPDSRIQHPKIQELMLATACREGGGRGISREPSNVSEGSVVSEGSILSEGSSFSEGSTLFGDSRSGMEMEGESRRACDLGDGAIGQ